MGIINERIHHSINIAGIIPAFLCLNVKYY